VLLAVVLLTQQNNNNNPTDTAAAATPTISQADKDLQILSIPVTDTVSQLDLKTITGTATLKLDAGAWKQTAPKPLDLDSTVVSSTVEQLKVLKGSTYIPPDKATDLKTYGLDNPSLVVTMTVASGVKTLQFGALNPASKNYYVKLAGDGRVWTVSSAVVDAITVLQTAPPTPAPTIGVTSGPLTPLPSVTPSPTAGTPTEAGSGPTATPTPIQTIPGGTPATATIVSGTTGPATATPASTPSPTTVGPAATATPVPTTAPVTTAATTTTAPATTQ
jgi:hypothetical protein